MATDNQEKSGQNDSTENDALLTKLTDFALRVFKVRSDEAEWQKILQAAPTDVITFLSQYPEIMAGILQASDEEAVKKLISQYNHPVEDALPQTGDTNVTQAEKNPTAPEVKSENETEETHTVSTAQSPTLAGNDDEQKATADTGAQAGDQAESATKDPEDDEAVSEPSEEPQASITNDDEQKATADTGAQAGDQAESATTDREDDEAVSGPSEEPQASTTNDDEQKAMANTGAQVSDQAESATTDESIAEQDGKESDNAISATSGIAKDQESKSETSASPSEPAASESETEVESCSDEMLIEFLKKVYAQKDRPESLGELLAKADESLLSRLDQNPFYVTEVIQMNNENVFNDFISQMKSTAGPIELSESIDDEAINDEVVSELLDNWAYINFDCEMTNPNNQQVKDYELDEGIMSWMSSVGVPVVCVPDEDDGKVVTVAMSMHGMLQGSIPIIGDGSGGAKESADEAYASPATRRMIAAFDLVDYIKLFEMGDIKIRSGHRNLLRNFWAICKLNGINCAGFEPSPAELMWYQKRESVLQSKFRINQEHEVSHAPGLSPTGGGGASPRSTEEEKGETTQAAKGSAPLEDTTSPIADQHDDGASNNANDPASDSSGQSEVTNNDMPEGAENTLSSSDENTKSQQENSKKKAASKNDKDKTTKKKAKTSTKSKPTKARSKKDTQKKDGQKNAGD